MPIVSEDALLDDRLAPGFGATPLRGTQSLVGSMAEVWKRPSLTALEVAWRWLAGLPLLWLGWRSLARVFAAHPLDRAALDGLTLFKPVEAATTLGRQLHLLAGPVWKGLAWWLPAAVLLWSVIAGFGKALVLRRYQPRLRMPGGTGAAFGLVRLLALLAVLALWCCGAVQAARWCITEPAGQGQEPNLVLYTAAVVGLTLGLFVLWSLGVWVLDLPPLLAATGVAVRRRAVMRVLRHPVLRSKVIELNFVMGIVKVCLLVLAMTFSASPLPFQNQQTAAFIDLWWAGVLLMYLLASDYFHVVRRVTYLRLLLSLTAEANVAGPPAS